ncbi:hypothetical protein [Pectobacterium aroidearum]|uniref:hypothetical protein n=1 Tax=Pectobacterium aroidearum TaxID=1201031 RepID=UPI003017EAF8
MSARQQIFDYIEKYESGTTREIKNRLKVLGYSECATSFALGNMIRRDELVRTGRRTTYVYSAGRNFNERSSGEVGRLRINKFEPMSLIPMLDSLLRSVRG